MNIDNIIVSRDTPEWQNELHNRTVEAWNNSCACLDHLLKWDQACADTDHLRFPAKTAGMPLEHYLANNVLG